mmetsp:Transcript_6556/g.10505  ORF Transcript_6556/g.10505 Transcript_6556/m.10505 type:complete len:454 (-) Transcript_6556:175-1536(-)
MTDETNLGNEMKAAATDGQIIDETPVTRRARLETNVVVRNTFIELDDEEEDLVKLTRRDRRSKTLPSSTTPKAFNVAFAEEVHARELSPSRPASVFSSGVMQVPDFPSTTPQASRRSSRRPSVEGSMPDLEPAHVVPLCLEAEASQEPMSIPTSPMKLVMANDIAPRTLTWQDHKLTSASVSAPTNGDESKVIGYVWLLSQDAQGCRLVQDELANNKKEVQVEIAEELRGHIYEALRSPHANFVVRKCVEVLAAPDLQFIIDELLSVGTFAICEVARNRFGCRIVESLFSNCPASQLQGLAEILIADSADLCGHMYGNFAMQTLLQYGTDEQKKKILEALETKMADFGHRFYALAVYRAGFKIAADEDKARISRALVAAPDVLITMSRYKNGPDFIEEALSHLDPATCSVVRGQLSAAANERQERAAKVSLAGPKTKGTTRFKSNKRSPNASR